MKRFAALVVFLFTTLPCFARYVEIFTEASRLTEIPRETLIGIAYVESGFDATSVGDGGKSIGMFQINETFREERIALMGREYDPRDVYDSAILTGKIYMKNLKASKSNIIAVAAHKQGLRGVRKNGICSWYVSEVALWGRVYSNKKIMVWVEDV